MFKTIEEFLINWGHESGSTQKILDALTDKSLEQEVSPEDRTLGRIAWHIVTTLGEMMSRTGLDFEATPHDAAVPTTAAEIAEAYRSSNEAMVAAIKEQWTDESLAEIERDVRGAMVDWNGPCYINSAPNTSPRSNDSTHETSRLACTWRLRTIPRRVGNVWRRSTGRIKT